MSWKSDIITGSDLDHSEDRVYLDGQDDTINIEIAEASEAYALVSSVAEEGDGVALVSIKINSKLGKALMRGLGRDETTEEG